MPNISQKTKVKMSIFVDAKIARAMKVQAALLGCKGISECVTKLFKLQEKSLKKFKRQRSPHDRA